MYSADDPAGNSFVESPSGKPEEDSQLTVEYYDRTNEQTRAIGLSTGNEIPQELTVPLW